MQWVRFWSGPAKRRFHSPRSISSRYASPFPTICSKLRESIPYPAWCSPVWFQFAVCPVVVVLCAVRCVRPRLCSTGPNSATGSMERAAGHCAIAFDPTRRDGRSQLIRFAQCRYEANTTRHTASELSERWLPAPSAFARALASPRLRATVNGVAVGWWVWCGCVRRRVLDGHADARVGSLVHATHPSSRSWTTGMCITVVATLAAFLAPHIDVDCVP
jgi:hypothetical protein